MSWLSDARKYAGLSLAIPKYVRERPRLTLEEARAEIKTRLQTREQRFLEMVERCIYGFPQSPYLPLLHAAGCELGDVRELIASKGLEPALQHLRDEGVYFSFEEFKGRRPVERGSVAFAPRPDDFDNPATSRDYWTQSGGSTGEPTRIWAGLDDTDRWDAHRLVAQSAHGLTGLPSASWGSADLNSVMYRLRRARRGTGPEKRFVSKVESGAGYSLKYAFASNMFRLAARIGGLRLPKAERIDPQNPVPVVRWAEEKLRSEGNCRIGASVSRGVRIALTASELGVDLTGATIVGTGEPATPGKVNAITESGARWISYYIFSEGGQVGFGCVNPVDGSDVHLYSDRVGLIQVPRQVPGTDLTVDAFNFTTLSYAAPKVLLNVEIDDFGIVEQRSCGCPLEELGYDRHIREIYSFQKLTGEGVTLVGSDLVRILEEVLPQRFGGSPLDYQLVEEEDENSLTRLSLIIDPSVHIDDESQVISTVLKELKATDAPSSMGGTIWAAAGTFRIKRMTPITSSWREKLMPLHVSRKSSANR